MNQIVLDGEKMNSKKTAHLYMKKKLNSTEYYGENLDALWDVLSTYNSSIKIQFINVDKLINNLGHYGKSIIKVFEEAELENKNIKIELICT